jgi:hypothetical protein
MLAIGVALLAYASSLPAYTDPSAFFEKYMQLAPGQSEEYWALRNSMLTPKFELEDYGILLLLTGTIALIFGGREIRSPKSKVTLVIIAICAPLFTVAGFTTDLLVGYSRDAFPHWSDSMAIPLMGMPVVLVALLAWAGAHLGLFSRDYRPGAPLRLALSLRANRWLLIIAAITFVLVVMSAVLGQYLDAIPGILWLYFYLSLAAGRISPLASNSSFKPNPPMYALNPDGSALTSASDTARGGSA